MKRLKTYNKYQESVRIDMEIPSDILAIHKLFKENGKKLYLVGGAVRDYLNNEKPKDFDLCTDALPDEVINILSDYKVNLQGKAFGVVVVYTKKGEYEIATFREDITKGRQPEVKLGATIEDDVKRRDLTYNALFYDLDSKEIVDLVGGESDLKSKKTRMVGSALERIEEDSLRILRAFRFSCRYNAPLDDELSKAIKSRNKLENIDPTTGRYKRVSQERIWDEILKAFKQSKDFTDYLKLIEEYDMWEQVFPDSKINNNIQKCYYLTTYMANLFKYNDTKTLEKKMVQMYRIDIDTAQRVVFLINFIGLNSSNAFDMYKNKIRFKVKDDVILDWIRVNNLKDSVYTKFLSYVPSVVPEELMKLGYKGADLGNKIKELEKQNFEKL